MGREWYHSGDCHSGGLRGAGGRRLQERKELVSVCPTKTDRRWRGLERYVRLGFGIWLRGIGNLCPATPHWQGGKFAESKLKIRGESQIPLSPLPRGMGLEGEVTPPSLLRLLMSLFHTSIGGRSLRRAIDNGSHDEVTISGPVVQVGDWKVGLQDVQTVPVCSCMGGKGNRNRVQGEEILLMSMIPRARRWQLSRAREKCRERRGKNQERPLFGEFRRGSCLGLGEIDTGGRRSERKRPRETRRPVNSSGSIEK